MARPQPLPHFDRPKIELRRLTPMHARDFARLLYVDSLLDFVARYLESVIAITDTCGLLGKGFTPREMSAEHQLTPKHLSRGHVDYVWQKIQTLMRRTEAGRAYGAVTAKALAVLNALLWGFHNAASGKCFPSYEAIAERAGCARSTVAEAIRALERAGILTWQNRIKRVREYIPGLFGKASAWRWGVQRTSNAYAFNDPSSKSEFKTGTAAQQLSERKIASAVPPARAITSRTVAAKPIRSINSIKTNGEEPNRGRL